jgi:hypothetical protein
MFKKGKHLQRVSFLRPPRLDNHPVIWTMVYNIFIGVNWTMFEVPGALPLSYAGIINTLPLWQRLWCT